MAFTKHASLENVQILEIKGSSTQARHASLGKLADFGNYRTSDGYLYARIRAISSRVNKNHDGWPSVELAGGQDVFDRHTSSEGFTVLADSSRDYGFSSFLGKPIFVDHHNSDPGRARGIIVDAKFHVDDHRTASLDPYYSSKDVDPEHLPASWVELLLEVDAKSFPKFAKAIIAGSRNPSKGIDGWSMGCFVAGTPITLADGTETPIEDIAEGDVVLTHTGKFEPVTALLRQNYIGTTYTVSTYGESHPMTLTEEHPVWTQDGWTEAKDLQPGDYVLTPRVSVESGISGANHPTARLLGYYVAEGNLGYDKKRFPDGRPVFVEWNFNAIKEAHFAQQVIEDLRAIGHTPAGPYTKNHCVTVRCNSPAVARQFKTLAGTHSWGKRLSAEVMTWDTEAQHELLMAYFRGDANRLTERRVEIGTASAALAHQVFTLANRVGIRMSPPTWQHSPSAIKAGKRPKYSLQGTLVAPAPSTLPHFYNDEQGLWRRITTITGQEHDGPVFNFDVGGDDSYVAVDIAVHNCDVAKSVCSICKTTATSPEEYCNHIKLKGAYFDWTHPDTRQKHSKLAYENCYGIKFFEISGVFDPADATALSLEQARTSAIKDKSLKDLADEQMDDYLDETEEGIQKRKKQDKAANFLHTAENPLPQSELYHAPEKVETLREEEICPVCGSSMDEDTCDVCGYQEPPDGFGNPDLAKAREVDDAPEGPEGESSPELKPEPTQLDSPGPQPIQTPNNPTALAHVTSDMSWDVHAKTSARINKVEQPIVATDKPATNEPTEKILSDQLRPVTSRVRTAEDFIAAAGATRRIQMNHTADAASGAPAVAKPAVSTDVLGVGGVDQASNDAASTPDAQVDVLAIGGTGVESVSADKEGVQVDQGDEHSKNIDAIHTDTWGPGEGDSLGQQTPVTREPFPAHEDGVHASRWIIEGHEDGSLESQDQQGGGTDLQGGGAVKGVKPIAESFGERVDVTESVTSPSNNSGPTTTWTGTDGNGVLKQQDPVTGESIALAESGLDGKPNWSTSSHVFTAFKLARLEVELGLVTSAREFDRAAELERESPTVLDAHLAYANRIRQATRKTAGIQKLPVMGRSAPVTKEASSEAQPTEDGSFMFGGV